jgi:hypothetical protein
VQTAWWSTGGCSDLSAAAKAASLNHGMLSGNAAGVFFCSIALGIWYGALKVADGTYNGGCAP